MRFWPGIIIAILPLFIAHYVQAQPVEQHLAHEISFTTDNDNYLLQKRDGYYTNGFYFTFQHLAGKHRPGKTIMRYELGQMIFNPYKYSITNPEQMDRPFAGYLFLKGTATRFIARGRTFQYGLSMGILGPASGAKQTQRGYHNLISIYNVEGWDYQVKNEPGLGVHAQYSQPILKQDGRDRVVDLHAVMKANLGNIFTNASAGFLFRVGLIEKSSESVAWNSRLHDHSPNYLHKKEFFLFFQPELMAQAYNATIEGGMFRRDKGPVLATREPLIYQHRIGLMYARQRMSIVLSDVHRTREAKQMRRKENYGSIALGYRFR